MQVSCLSRENLVHKSPWSLIIFRKQKQCPASHAHCLCWIKLKFWYWGKRRVHIMGKLQCLSQAIFIFLHGQWEKRKTEPMAQAARLRRKFTQFLHWWVIKRQDSEVTAHALISTRLVRKFNHQWQIESIDEGKQYNFLTHIFYKPCLPS